MPETRGYETINDRTDGWGPGVDEDLVPTEDAEREPIEERVTREVKEYNEPTGSARPQAVATDTPDLLDREKGAGGDFDTTAGADEGYRTDGPDEVWEDEDLDLGEDYDLTETGDFENPSTTGPEHTVTGRPVTRGVHANGEPVTGEEVF